MNATNGYGVAPTVAPVRFDGAKLAGGTLTATLPAKSVVTLELK
jgi:alpha-L-arabinofuranosidase